MADETQDFMSADDYGRSLGGFGVNLLVRDVMAQLAFLKAVFDLEPLHANKDFAIIRYLGHDLMLHGDHTYHSHPLPAVVGDSQVRGAGVELRLYDLDPDQAEARARAAGYEVLAATADKPHGLREAYLIGPDNYIWVPGIKLAKKA